MRTKSKRLKFISTCNSLIFFWSWATRLCSFSSFEFKLEISESFLHSIPNQRHVRTDLLVTAKVIFMLYSARSLTRFVFIADTKTFTFNNYNQNCCSYWYFSFNIISSIISTDASTNKQFYFLYILTVFLLCIIVVIVIVINHFDQIISVKNCCSKSEHSA